jgi:energy-coupling factor transporter ATP-binding protein EcfA2
MEAVVPLKKLMLRDFQGGTFSLQAQNGEDLNIYGSNGSGKTRLMSAFLWLITGKDSLGRGDFEIKNIDASGNQEHGLDHSVDAIFDLGGNDLTLKKVYHEVWTKKRGSAKAEMTGNTTDHFIDGVPVKENEYKARVAEIFGDENRFRLLTNPAAFAAMPWQKQRTLLLEVCGDIPDNQIIESDETLSPLINALSKYNARKTPLDDLKKVTMGRRVELNKQIDQIPVRIDESQRGLPDVSGLDKSVLSIDISSLESQINGAKLRLAGVDTGGKIAPLTKELNAVNAEISGLENAHSLKQSEIVTRLNRQIRELTETREAGERKFKSINVEIEEKKVRMISLDKSMSTLRDDWAGIDEEVFQDTTQLACAACGQNLPADKVEAAREKAKSAFNTSKAERLSYVQSEGKRLKDERNRVSGEIKHLEDLISVPLNFDRTEIERLTQERDTAKANAGDYSGIVGRQDLLDRKTAIEKAISDAKGSVSEDRAVISKEIAEIEPKLSEAKEKYGRFERRESGEKRIQELKAEEKKFAQEFEEMEKMLFLIESFIKTKVSMLNDKINSKFEIVRFRLFNQLVNGGIEECCVFTINGVPYDGGLNAAARTQGGLDIIRTLQKHYGIAPVVFVDNRESVSDIPDMDCQIVNLIVSPQDKTLRVETATNKTAAKIAA